jgi:hypothetical protein
VIYTIVIKETRESQWDRCQIRVLGRVGGTIEKKKGLQVIGTMMIREKKGNPMG